MCFTVKIVHACLFVMIELIQDDYTCTGNDAIRQQCWKILNSIILTTLSTIAVWRGVSHCQRMVKRMVISYCRAAHTDKHRKRSTTVARFLRQHQFTLHSMHVAVLARVSFFWRHFGPWLWNQSPYQSSFKINNAKIALPWRRNFNACGVHCHN